MLLAGFRRQAAYRLAAVTGLVTNAFFGAVRTAVFLALYRQRGQVAGMDLSDALTYVWVLEALFGVIWVAWFWETAESIRSGDFVVELLRPGDLYLRLLAFDLGRSLNLLMVRAAPAIAVAALLLPLRLPGSPAGLALFGTSLLLAAVVGFQLRLLFSAAAFWTADYRSLWGLVFPVVWLVSGFMVPVEYFPAALRLVADASPLTALVMAPVRVASGRARRAAAVGGGAVAGGPLHAGGRQPAAGGPRWLRAWRSTCGWRPRRCAPTPASRWSWRCGPSPPA
jgi:ABC-2 type transport system permease protein